MIGQTALVNTFGGGMNMDMDVTLLPNDQYRYAENVRLVTNDGGTSGVLQNIEGVKPYGLSLPEGEEIIGCTTVDKYAVVFTKVNGINKVYRIEGFHTDNPTYKVVLKGKLGLGETGNNLSLVSNYESDKVMKIYFTDGTSQIKVFDILDTRYEEGTDSGLVDDNGNIINNLALDATPGAQLPPFNLVGVYAGSLPTGVVQYCYQLFTLHGTESTLSSISSTIHLSSSNTSSGSQEYEGSYPNESAGKAIKMQTSLITKNFEKCRIIRILYTDNNSIPQIHVLDEFDILPTQDVITYTDKGESFMAEITIEEFNNLLGYQFFAKSIAKLQNRLFAANVTEDTWDPGWWDARAYRCNKNGVIRLESANSDNTLVLDGFDEEQLKSVPEDHDCINPYNNIDYTLSEIEDRYQYYTIGTGSATTYVLGGKGLNVSYELITAPLQMTEVQSQYRADNYCNFNVPATNSTSITVKTISTLKETQLLFEDKDTTSRILNYADPYIASKLKGYQRDEIYRFGIIFYNKKHIPSPVYWIGDIKMPHNQQSAAFTYEELVDGKYQLYGNALGIKFKVNNIPNEAMGYDIVRCDRTEFDRTVLMQCGVTALYKYSIQEQDGHVTTGSTISNSIEMRPAPFLTCCRALGIAAPIHRQWQTYVSNNKPAVEHYKRLISPEICVSKDGVSTLLNLDSYLDYVGSFLSKIKYDSITKSVDGISHDDILLWHDLPDNVENVTFASRVFTAPNSILQASGSTIKNIITLENYIAYVPSHDSTLININIMLHGRDVLSVDNYHEGKPYNTNLAKYYFPSYHSDLYLNKPQYNILDAKYSGDIPYNSFSQGVLAYRINIGERTYTNYSTANFAVPGNNVTLGPAGPSFVILLDNTNEDQYFTNVSTFVTTQEEAETELDKVISLPIANVKRKTVQYGGNTFNSRQNSIYLSTSSFALVSAKETIVYGGDTFLNILDYPSQFTFQANDETYWNTTRRFFVNYIPFESSINMNLFNGDMAHRTYTQDNYIDSHLQLDPTQKGSYHAQDRPYYSYNAVYSSQNGSRKFVPKSIYAESDMTIRNRIVSSQAKVNNEVLDNWSQFKVADYLDVDAQYGEVTNIKNFKDRLFYFQPTAVGIAAVNERVLADAGDVGQLTLGTGGVLARFDYLTTVNGSSIINDRSIIGTDNTLYWYDYDKNEICAYVGHISSMSKTGQVQSYFNEMYGSKRDNIMSHFDKKYNEVWFNVYDKTLVLNEQMNKFTAFYTFNPDWTLCYSDLDIAIKDNNFYRLNTVDTDGTNGISKDAKIQLVINKDLDNTKTFDNVRFQGIFLNKNNQPLTTEIDATATFSTKHQTTGLQDLNEIIDYREDGYRFAIPRQQTNEEDISLSYPARMRGKYLICDYTFKADDESTFKIPTIVTTYRYSLV